MDDNRSIISIYWDTKSITSEFTVTDSCFQTPIGSLSDLSNSDLQTDVNNIPNSELSGGGIINGYISLTPTVSELKLSDEIAAENIEIEATENDISSEKELTILVQPIVPIRPPPIRLKKCPSAELDSSPKLTEKKDWRRSFAKRVSFTKTRIMKSISMNKHESKGLGDHNILLSMRNSIRRLRSTSKHKSAITNERKTPETIKDALGSDCDHFNFEKLSIQINSEINNDVFDSVQENTPIKPRRQFPQDKYLTGSEEVLQKAYNSLNRKSQIQEDKSVFDLCSTLSYLFVSDDDKPMSATSNKVPQFVTECLNAFLEMNAKQIEHGLELVNKNLGRYFDLFSESLDHVDQSRKYKVEELLGSAGVCVITDIESRQRFVALRRASPRHWISFTGFLQHIEKDLEPMADQLWVCYPADSITNMYLERDCFEARFCHSKSVLDTLLQLLVLLRSQLIGHCAQDMAPSSVLLISSHLSLICVHDQSGLCPDREQTAVTDININCDEEMRTIYQQSLMHLNHTVSDFLADPDNACHLISASYPLDYLFFVILKLHRDVNVLLDSI